MAELLDSRFELVVSSQGLPVIVKKGEKFVSSVPSNSSDSDAHAEVHRVRGKYTFSVPLRPQENLPLFYLQITLKLARRLV